MTVLPVPNPPGTATLPPSATGKSRSKTRCPVMNGTCDGESLAHRAGAPHRPTLGEGERGAVGKLPQRLVHGVLAAGDGRHRASDARWEHDPMLEARAFRDGADQVAGVDRVTRCDARREQPAPFRVERGADRAGENEVAGVFRHALERPTDAIEHRPEQPGAEFNGEGIGGELDRLTHGETTRFLIDLDRSALAAHPHHLTEQPALAHAHQFVERRTVERLGFGQRTDQADQTGVAHRSLTR